MAAASLPDFSAVAHLGISYLVLEWFALQVQSRLAKLASATLRGKGYEEFLPLCRSLRESSKGDADTGSLLFPGYLFCRFDPCGRLLPILTTPGVMRIVSLGKTPVPVTEEEIESIKMVTRSGAMADPWPFPDAGQTVVIEKGPLSGLEGIVVEAGGTQRLVVSVSLLRRSIAVDIDRSWARCLPPVAGGEPQRRIA